MNASEAMSLIQDCLHEVAPDVSLDTVAATDNLQETMHLDSLDFLRVVELLSDRSGIRIDEEDYPRLATLSSATDFLAGASIRD